MKTYHSVHESLWPYISNVCLPKSILVNIDTLSTSVVDKWWTNTKVHFILPSTWAIYDGRNYSLFKELTKLPDTKEGRYIDDSQLYSNP